MPFYIVHGIGLNVLNFKNLSLYVDADQPIFGFQAKGLDGIDEPLDDIIEIAKAYVLELIAHNPTGPYAIGGYSIGGFIAVEMARQLELMNREVKFLAIFDTDADYSKEGSRIMPHKISVGEIVKFSKLLSHYPLQTLHNLKRHFREPENPYDQLVLSLKSDSRSFYAHMKEIRVRLEDAFQRYQFTRFNGSIYLFRAGVCIHFTKDKQYLGWRKYAAQGVKEFKVPGDHSTIFNAKNAVVLGKLLQDALDSVSVLV
jgi:thioesterase domain-containing protein